ncbi:hypothetical protein [Allokutzneria multivorans]|uniref:hypothetical protein n=1 Tax=Allokutzneria multivorans TaxID=1142134 RepID=UPI0031EB710A
MKSFLAITTAVVAVSAGVTTGTADAAYKCTGRASGWPGSWGSVSKQCVHFAPNDPKWGGYIIVGWGVQPGTSQQACVEGRMSRYTNPDKWQSLGCGKGNKGKIAWPRNSASMLEIRVKSASIGVALVEYGI